MRCTREKTFSLVRELGFLTLNSRADFDMCMKFLNQEEFTDSDLKEEMELTEILFDPPSSEELKFLMYTKSLEKDVKRAAMYYKSLRFSFNANGETFGGRKCDIRRFFVDIWNMSKAFANVVVENKDFEALIKQYDRPFAFIYCDPPYYDAEGFYKNDVPFTKEDHIRLRDTLVSAEGYVMVSYNNSAEIKKLYEDFYIYYTTRQHNMSKKEGEVYEELIMTNYDPSKHTRGHNFQMHLFGGYVNCDCEGDYKLIHKPEKPLKKE